MHDRMHRWFAVLAMMALVLSIMAYLIQTSAPALQAAQAQDTGQTMPAPQTPWGEPDLQGMWSVELLVPLERPDGITTEFYTEEQVAELDRQRANMSVFGNHLRAEPGSEADVSGAYNSVFTSQRPTAQRTGMVIGPAGREGACHDFGGASTAGRDPRV